ncbi:MAG: BamA/OMP85 family outer membrane protein, partial [Myxococcota bacterium]
MFRLPAWLALALGLFAACATVEEQAQGPRVERLRIEGARQVDEDELKEKILTAESSWLPAWVPIFGEEHRFDPNAWQADLRRIERLYQSRGYYQARVLDEEVKELAADGVELWVRVDEGSATVLRTVEVRGLDRLPPEHGAAALEKLPLNEGDVFLEENWVGVKEAIAARLRELGYVEAVVNGEAQVDVATRSAHVRLEVESGPRYRFGNIVVAANAGARVAPKRVVEQVESELQPGDWYYESALAKAQARVFQMGVFGAVKVTRSSPERAAGTVPVVVDVREAPFHTRRAGLGFGFDQTRQDVRLVGEYTDRNFLGGLRRLTVRGKLGYAFLPDAVSVLSKKDSTQAGPVTRVVAELEQPRLFSPALSFATSLELSSGIEPAYNFIGGSYKAGVVWRPRTDVTVYPSYNLELYWLSSPTPLGGRSPAVTFGCPTLCVLSYLEQTIELDRRDDRLEPRRGYLLAFSLQEGGGPLGGAFSFVRVQPEARGYVSFFDDQRLTLAGKLKIGSLLTAAGAPSPIVSRFFSGGAASMRGFNDRRLSPLLAVPLERKPDEGETLPIGGNGVLEASIELRYHLGGDWVLATFLDGGFVTPGSFDALDPAYYSRNLLLAAGFGLRYRTPLGPIRADFARRLPVGPPLPVIQSSASAVDFPVHN